jgi:hypothetical protein
MASKPTFKETLKTNAIKITDIVNDNNLFGDDLLMELYIEEKNPNIITIGFKINENNFSEVDYFKINSELQGRAKGVKSDIGNLTGSLLFNLNLLLMVLSNVVYFSLANYTDDPARAANGIYELLDVNQSAEDTGYSASDWSYKSPQEKLLMSEGEMKLNINNIHSDIKNKLKNIIDSRNVGESSEFIYQINQHWSTGGKGGSKRKTRNRKTRNRKTRNRKTRNRKTKNRKTKNRKTKNRKTRNRKTTR